MANTRLDIRTRVRDYLYEAVADKWSDAQLNRLYTEETNSLPSQFVALDEPWTMTTQANVRDYTLPTGTTLVDKLERNDGSATYPDWNDLNGWNASDGSLHLPYLPPAGESLRAQVRRSFTVVTDDVTAIDIPDAKSEILVWGIVIRAYRMLIGYLRGNVSWDSVTKPGDLSITTIQNYLRDAKDEYKELIKLHQKSPRTKDINLVS